MATSVKIDEWIETCAEHAAKATLADIARTANLLARGVAMRNCVCGCCRAERPQYVVQTPDDLVCSTCCRTLKVNPRAAKNQIWRRGVGGYIACAVGDNGQFKDLFDHDLLHQLRLTVVGSPSRKD